MVPNDFDVLINFLLVDSLAHNCQVTVGKSMFVIEGYGRYSLVSRVYKLKDGAWFEFSSLKIARDYHMCSVLDGIIYVMGGWYNHTFLTSVEMLHPGSNEWVEGPPLPGAVWNGQSVVYSNTVFVVGGLSSVGVSNTKIYRLASDHWVTEEVSLDFPQRAVFPAPLTSNNSLLHCEQ